VKKNSLILNYATNSLITEACIGSKHKFG
jgi:hypothetical protein